METCSVIFGITSKPYLHSHKIPKIPCLHINQKIFLGLVSQSDLNAQMFSLDISPTAHSPTQGPSLQGQRFLSGSCCHGGCQLPRGRCEHSLLERGLLPWFCLLWMPNFSHQWTVYFHLSGFFKCFEGRSWSLPANLKVHCRSGLLVGESQLHG